MAIYGVGGSVDITFIPDAAMLTTTSQFKVVGLAPTTTATDKTVAVSGATGTSVTIEPTSTAYYAIGVNQSYLSAGSADCTVRIFGVSKVTCAETVTAGHFVMAYWGASTTTMAGRVVQVDNGVTITAYGGSVSSQCVILGRALESGITGSVISVFVNPQLYDMSLVGSISIT